MALMIPAFVPADTRSAAERQMFALLRDKLDASFTVFHSFNLLSRNREGAFIDGEIDFLIFSPDAGLLVLEVKGGSIAYDGKTGAWIQNGRPLVKSPFTQARTAKYQLSDFLKRRLITMPPIPFGHAVCFPDVPRAFDQLPSGAEQDICLTRQDFPYLAQAIANTMATFKRHGAVRLDEQTTSRIRQVLMPYCEYGISLADRIEGDERRIFELTEHQCLFLDFIRNQKQALIEGCAGSGKTVMAVKKAHELAAAGKKVLLLAFNQLIGKHLAKSVAGLENVTAATYHKFCVDTLKAADCLPEMRRDQKYWNSDIPEALAKLLSEHPVQFDAVIVDEGQDFLPAYWSTIASLVNPDGLFYIFYDPMQNLLGRPMEYPIAVQPFVLPENCRQTRAIFEKLKPLGPAAMRLKEPAPDGEQVVEFSNTDPSLRRKELGRILNHLVNEQQLKRESIAIIGGHTLGKTCINGDPIIGNFRIVEKQDTGTDTIRYYTHMKFKGCESDAVILLDVDRADKRWTDVALYTSVSRAKHVLYVIGVGK